MANMRRLLASNMSTETPTPALPLPRTTLFLMAACAATSVANVYYAQPLLDAVGGEFGISTAAVGGVISATQLGCALALAFVVPLGDLMNRKLLLCLELALLALVLLAVSISPTPLAMLAGMVGLGLLGTAATQGTIAYAATLSSPATRGSTVGAIQSGVLVGVLGARSLAGFVADLAGWRAVFVVSAVIAAGMLALMMKMLPALAVAPARLGYPALLMSMVRLLATERVLQVRGMLGLLIFAALGAFWSAVALPLREPPYQLPYTAIGMFGLVGIAGALTASRAGRWADKGHGQRTSMYALLCMMAAWAPLAMLPQSLWILGAGIVLLDMGGQAVHVTNQTMIFKTRPEMHSRLVGCYMLFYAAGLGLGAITATTVFARVGWSGVCWLGFGISAAALAFWRLTLRAATVPAAPNTA